MDAPRRAPGRDDFGGSLVPNLMHFARALRAAGLPIAWNLAGGYQQPLRKVLDIHDHTLRECMAVFEPGAASA